LHQVAYLEYNVFADKLSIANVHPVETLTGLNISYNIGWQCSAEKHTVVPKIEVKDRYRICKYIFA